MGRCFLGGGEVREYFCPSTVSCTRPPIDLICGKNKKGSPTASSNHILTMDVVMMAFPKHTLDA